MQVEDTAVAQEARLRPLAAITACQAPQADFARTLGRGTGSSASRSSVRPGSSPCSSGPSGADHVAVLGNAPGQVGVSAAAEPTGLVQVALSADAKVQDNH